MNSAALSWSSKCWIARFERGLAIGCTQTCKTASRTRAATIGETSWTRAAIRLQSGIVHAGARTPLRDRLPSIDRRVHWTGTYGFSRQPEREQNDAP